MAARMIELGVVSKPKILSPIQCSPLSDSDGISNDSEEEEKKEDEQPDVPKTEE